MLYGGSTFLVALTVIYQSRAWTSGEIGIWATINLLYLGNGLAYFIHAFDTSKFTYELGKRPHE